jgi:hypothetical protein
MLLWQGLTGAERQYLEFISGPCTAAKTTLLSFNRTQSRVVRVLLIGHTLRKYLHITGLTDSPLCRKRGAQDETSARVLCECDALATLGRTYLGSFILDAEDVGV